MCRYVIYKIMTVFIQSQKEMLCLVNELFTMKFAFSWYPLANKEGRVDKARGEIQATLQFYSKNNTTGSVFDLSTKKKHLSLKDIKHSLGDKLKSASKHHKSDRTTGENQVS